MYVPKQKKLKIVKLFFGEMWDRSVSFQKEKNFLLPFPPLLFSPISPRGQKQFFFLWGKKEEEGVHHNPDLVEGALLTGE